MEKISSSCSYLSLHPRFGDHTRSYIHSSIIDFNLIHYIKYLLLGRSDITISIKEPAALSL